MLDKIRIYILAVKYWMNGDDWEAAVDFAKFIVEGFKRR